MIFWDILYGHNRLVTVSFLGTSGRAISSTSSSPGTRRRIHRGYVCRRVCEDSDHGRSWLAGRVVVFVEFVQMGFALIPLFVNLADGLGIGMVTTALIMRWG
jgi:hypothetical protein